MYREWGKVSIFLKSKLSKINLFLCVGIAVLKVIKEIALH